MTIDYEVIYDGIYDIVQPLITPIPLIRDYQSDSKPAEKYCTMRLVNLTPVGFKQEYSTLTAGEYEIRQTYSLTVRFNMIGKETSTDASKLHIKLQRPTVVDSFLTLGLHYYDRTSVRDVPKLMSTGFEDRSTFDIKFYVVSSDIDNPGWIEFVEITEQYKKPDNSVAVEETTVIDLDP